MGVVLVFELLGGSYLVFCEFCRFCCMLFDYLVLMLQVPFYVFFPPPLQSGVVPGRAIVARHCTLMLMSICCSGCRVAMPVGRQQGLSTRCWQQLPGVPGARAHQMDTAGCLSVQGTRLSGRWLNRANRPLLRSSAHHCSCLEHVWAAATRCACARRL